MLERVLSLVPKKMRLPLVMVFVWDMVVYSGSRLITAGLHHFQMALPIDGWIPFLPWTVSIYLICYLFWAANYIMAMRQPIEEASRFLSAELLSKVICLVLFFLFPTTAVRPATGEGFWNAIMAFVYRVDAADNLFPSLHCLLSWFCYIGVRKNPEVPKWYRVFSLVFALLVCASTVTTKQHVIVDVFAGVLLAELCYGLAEWLGLRARIQRLLS